MEKIKASEVLNELKGVESMYFTTDLNGAKRVHTSKPIIGIESFSSSFSICISKSPLPQPNWKNSLREIDFSEDFTEGRISLVNRIDSYLAKELSLRDYNRIKGFFEEMTEVQLPKKTSIGIGNPVFDSDDNLHESNANKSIFQEGDTVHVLSYSNQGELGVSTQGVVKAIKSNSFVAVEIVNGIEEIHEEKNISFTPFSIHEAGFSQVRPQREIKEGDWGFFYDDDKWFVYGQLHKIGGKTGTYALYHHELGSEYNYFSHTPPQLADGIPNPFKEC